MGAADPNSRDNSLAKKTAHLLLICAGGLAAFSGWRLGDELFLRSASAALAASAPQSTGELQKSNRVAKRDRDAVAVQPAEIATPVLASFAPETTAPEATASIPVIADSKPAVSANAHTDVSPLPAPKPKPVARIEKLGRALLTDLQVAGIKQRLALTAAQERYWPPVEKALRGLTERVADYRKNSKKSKDDAEAAEVEQLKAAALPLLAQLRDDQKSTVIVLANMAGLGPVVTDMFSGNTVASSSN